MSLMACSEEERRRDEVLARVVDLVRRGQAVKLPLRDGPSPPSDFALLSICRDGNPFSGYVGDYLYQFEGEDDLLHLFVVRRSGLPLSVEEAQHVVSFAIPHVPPALIWLKPGTVSQHFYFSHDLLLEGLS